MLPARWRLFRPVHGSGMLAHCRDRLVCVLVLELGGGVRLPYINQSLFGRIETLHSICPFDVSYRAFPGCGPPLALSCRFPMSSHRSLLEAKCIVSTRLEFRKSGAGEYFP